jgi:hypothetical protein
LLVFLLVFFWFFFGFFSGFLPCSAPGKTSEKIEKKRDCFAIPEGENAIEKRHFCRKNLRLYRPGKVPWAWWKAAKKPPERRQGNGKKPGKKWKNIGKKLRSWRPSWRPNRLGPNGTAKKVYKKFTTENKNRTETVRNIYRLKKALTSVSWDFVIFRAPEIRWPADI